MDRLLYNDLLSWKRQPRRKPVLIDGARQTGKTHLIEQILGARQFRKVHKLDFNFAPGLASVFADGLAPRTIVDNIEVRFNEPVDLARDLIFFDEVGDCQSALDSLKYFAEQMPNAFICATGSNVGLLTSFPVGKVSRLELFPLCFEEFVMASGQTRLLEMFRTRAKSSTAHERLWSLFLDYTFVGGMPEAVAAWFDPRHGMAQRISQVETIHSDLVTGFERDFGKYAGPAHAQHIDAVFHNIPRQLETTLDGSVKRFRFQGVVTRKRGYQDLRGPIDWLEKCRLAWKCYPIVSEPTPPLPHLTKESRFRLFLFDIGILRYLLRLPYVLQREPKYGYKGFIAENFVQTELCARVGHPTYGWAEGRAEIEFLHQARNGEIVPVEVKSRRRGRAKSLSSYTSRYAPERAITLTADPRGGRDGVVTNWPLYEAQFLGDL
ncbi:MAG: AAA family ATPase [Gammaproteobacteria bacterium]|nr:AAA family ATPase [Gammaproteobacteria bacterium]